MKRCGWCLFLAAIVMSTMASAHVYEVYVASSDFIRGTTTLDDVVPELIHSPGNHELSLAVHQNKVYWSNRTLGTISRCNTDGSMVEEVISGLTQPLYLHLDGAVGKMYWSSSNIIMSANLDGSAVAPVVNPGAQVAAIATHADSGKIYWFQFESMSEGGIKRVNLDGTNIEDVTPEGFASGGGGAHFAYMSIISSAVFFNSSLYGLNTIYQMDLDGANPVPIVTGNSFKGGLRADEEENALYWVELVYSSFELSIRRFFLGGAQSENIAIIAPQTEYFSCAKSGGVLYWSDNAGMFRQTVPDTRVIASVTSDVTDMKVTFAPGASAGYLYWAEMDTDPFVEGTGAIYRVRTDGENRETLHDGLNSVFGIEVDRENNLLYWADMLGEKIYRSTLSGGAATEIITIHGPLMLALDAVRGVLYGTRVFSGIYAFYLENETLQYIGGGNRPFALALDGSLQKLYYTEVSMPGVWSINSDGTGATQIFSLSSVSVNMALDTAEGHLYWMRNDRLKRLSVDGSEYEELREIGGKYFALRTEPPHFLTIVGSSRVSLGSSVTLHIGGLPPLEGNVTYEWYRDNVLISGAPANTCEIIEVGYEHAGEYRVVVTDESKNIYMSLPFHLIVLDAPLPAVTAPLLAGLAAVLTAAGVRRFRKQR